MIPPRTDGSTALPPLREDLNLFPGAPGPGGTPAWLIHDRPRNRFFRLGWLESELLIRWASTADDRGLAERINRETTLHTDAGRVREMIEFLRHNDLTRPASTEAVHELAARAQQRPGWGTWLLHHYLFFRIPLWRPDPFLTRLMPWLGWLFQRWFAILLVFLGMTGLFLVSRQWEAFLGTFSFFYSLQGALFLALAIVFAKVCHEFGHALIAKFYGCRVPVMGVAFLVLWPLAYTDTSDTWRLTDKKQRLRVASGGMIAELMLAILATLAWNLVDEGILKSVFFSLATVTWTAALAINANPFMRFDGYFILSDHLDIPNLQDRAFALGRWRLRHFFLGIDEPPPETWPRHQRRFLIGYAWATWTYRFFLFLGIALLVYHFFFKVLGVFLMVVEIHWFILRPIGRELLAWYRRRDDVSRGSAGAGLLLILSLLAVLFIPWQNRITVPAVLRSESFAWIHPPVPGRLESIHVREGRRVRVGDPLFILAAPDLDHQLRLNQLDLERFGHESRRPGQRREAREDRLLAAQRLRAARERRQSLLDNRRRLTIAAPLSGVVTELAPGLKPGRWLGREARLAHIRRPDSDGVRAWLEEKDRHRVVPGVRGLFYAEEPLRPPLPVRVTAVDPQALSSLEWKYAASSFKGAIPVRKKADGRLIPTRALYRVRLKIITPPALESGRVLRGTVQLRGERQSLARGLWHGVLALWIRESGF